MLILLVYKALEKKLTGIIKNKIKYELLNWYSISSGYSYSLQYHYSIDECGKSLRNATCMTLINVGRACEFFQTHRFF